jgi:hypothetical protein
VAPKGQTFDALGTIPTKTVAPPSPEVRLSVHTDRTDQDMKRDDIDYCESCGYEKAAA